MISQEILQERLKRHRSLDLGRVLALRAGHDFTSNDYLSFSTDPRLKARVADRFSEIEMGSAGSRLLRGHLPIFDEAETSLAAFCGREAALLYPSGYQANVGLFSALLRPEDRVFSDQLNHASIIDGIRLSGAQKKIYAHGDLNDLRRKLEESSNSQGLKVIVSESLFSMDGDCAPLEGLARLAEEFSAFLVVDESHATGLWGRFNENRGGGLVQEAGLNSRVFATVHTGGKALGVGGAWICGSEFLKSYLVNFSRAFIFSTAPIPLLACSLMASMEHWQEEGVRRARTVLENSKRFRSSLCEIFPPFRLESGMISGPIIPIKIGANGAALEAARQLQDRGYDVRAIRPPTVPSGTSRLRLTLQFCHPMERLDRLARTLGEVLGEN